MGSMVMSIFSCLSACPHIALALTSISIDSENLRRLRRNSYRNEDEIEEVARVSSYTIRIVLPKNFASWLRERVDVKQLFSLAI